MYNTLAIPVLYTNLQYSKYSYVIPYFFTVLMIVLNKLFFSESESVSLIIHRYRYGLVFLGSGFNINLHSHFSDPDRLRFVLGSGFNVTLCSSIGSDPDYPLCIYSVPLFFVFWDPDINNVPRPVFFGSE